MEKVQPLPLPEEEAKSMALRQQTTKVVAAPPFSLGYSPSLPVARTTPYLYVPKLPRSQTSCTPPRHEWESAAHHHVNPVLQAINSLREYVDDFNRLTTAAPTNPPLDDWLPVTERRKGNAFFAAFHSLCSGIGFQTLLLPVAFAALGWTWGILCFFAFFFWQFYTTWILTRLHEADVIGTRYSRYLHLCSVAFGPKPAKLFGKFPIMYLSGGTCTTLIIMGAGSMKIFYEILCDSSCSAGHLTGVEWYLVFVGIAVIIAQLPNLHAMAGVSLVGGVMAISYCTLAWVSSVAEGRPEGVTYQPAKGRTHVDRFLSIANALGLIAFAFRGHNLVLEIQGTMPSSQKSPSHVPMWRGVRVANALILLCLLPTATLGYWSYGDLIPRSGLLSALHKYHGHDVSKAVLGLTSLLLVINCLMCYQIYAIPVFDNFEMAYVSKRGQPCPLWLRSLFRVLFGGLTFFIATAFPFLPDLAGLMGAVALPITLVYPCFIWIVIKKPKRQSSMWYTNWGLGLLGAVLTVVLIACGIWNLIYTGVHFRFFKAQLDGKADFIGSTSVNT